MPSKLLRLLLALTGSILLLVPDVAPAPTQTYGAPAIIFNDRTKEFWVFVTEQVPDGHYNLVRRVYDSQGTYKDEFVDALDVGGAWPVSTATALTLGKAVVTWQSEDEVIAIVYDLDTSAVQTNMTLAAAAFTPPTGVAATFNYRNSKFLVAWREETQELITGVHIVPVDGSWTGEALPEAIFDGAYAVEHLRVTHDYAANSYTLSFLYDSYINSIVYTGTTVTAPQQITSVANGSTAALVRAQGSYGSPVTPYQNVALFSESTFLRAGFLAADGSLIGAATVVGQATSQPPATAEFTRQGKPVFFNARIDNANQFSPYIGFLPPDGASELRLDAAISGITASHHSYAIAFAPPCDRFLVAAITGTVLTVRGASGGGPNNCVATLDVIPKPLHFAANQDFLAVKLKAKARAIKVTSASLVGAGKAAVRLNTAGCVKSIAAETECTMELRLVGSTGGQAVSLRLDTNADVSPVMNLPITTAFAGLPIAQAEPINGTAAVDSASVVLKWMGLSPRPARYRVHLCKEGRTDCRVEESTFAAP